MADKKEFTQEYADDVKKRFEKSEKEIVAMVEWLLARGYKSPSK